jgi:hypothetical protein
MENRVFKSVRAAAILTGSYVADTVIPLPQHASQVNLYVDFTIGSLTSAEIKVEFAEDQTGSFYQDCTKSISSGVQTVDLSNYKITATGKYRISIPVKDAFMKVSVKGTGTVTASTMTVDAVYGLL